MFRGWVGALTIIVAAESVLAAALASHYGLHGGIPWFAYYFLWVAVTVIVGLAAFLFWLFRLFRRGVERPARHMLETLRGLDRRVVAAQLMPLVLLPAFMASHTTFKAVLPHLTPYFADPPLVVIDRFLTFGVDPWRVTHAVFGGPAATLVIDRLYFAYFFVTYLMLFLAAFHPRLARHRGQVFLTYVLCWILLGALMAVATASVGPCYYGLVYPGQDPFAELMARLREIDASLGGTADAPAINALRAQAKLWGDHAGDTVGFGSGISAMPSMHISVATVTALLLRRLGWGWLGLLYFLGMLIGSVHLGWHYAVDGYFAALATLAVWRLVAIALGQKSVSQAPSLGRRAKA